jgi:penicillin-binding protein 1A
MPEAHQLLGGRLWRIRRWLFVPCLMLVGAAGVGLYLLTRVPLPSAHPLSQTTFIYDSSGEHVLATFSEQNRVPVQLSQVPPLVVDAVVSTEDRHFFTEGALNPVSILRAALNDLSGSGDLQGASTITQQYVKQTYLTSQRNITRKIKEAALAIRLSRTESKDEILQNYLNTIYWGRGAYGIEAAARAYFGVDVGQLDLADASLLAGMIREPDTADPARNAAVARQNQDDTLRAMIRDKKIDAAQAEAVQTTPFAKYVISPSSSSGVVNSGAQGDAYFIAAVRAELLQEFPSAEVDGDGLKVYTTLDPTLQTEAFNAVYGNNPDSLQNPRDPSGALVSIDNNGEVRAFVGGRGYSNAAGSEVDLALGDQGGGGGRQAGSTFKAFMLAYLLKEGYSPQSMFPAPAEVIIPHGNSNGTPWDVKNFKGETAATPNVSLIQATANSINTVYAQVVDRLGAQNLLDEAEQFGISPHDPGLGPYPSLVLGTASVSPLEMAAAYATFADNGIYHAPLLITRITNAAGQNLPLPVQPVTRQVLTPSVAAQETYVLQQVVLDGTGTAAGGVGSPVAGKTGTTENSEDAWFIGYTPTLTTAMWMGYFSGEIPMVNFRGLASVQGGTIPAELWHNYMVAALASEPQYKGDFPTVYEFNNIILTPPPASTLIFPDTTTTSTTTSSTTTTVPKSTTTNPSASTTVTPTTAPKSTTTTGTTTTVPKTPTTS